eukprot:2488674-Prymnesium_polylepis.1
MAIRQRSLLLAWAIAWAAYAVHVEKVLGVSKPWLERLRQLLVHSAVACAEFVASAPLNTEFRGDRAVQQHRHRREQHHGEECCCGASCGVARNLFMFDAC